MRHTASIGTLIVTLACGHAVAVQAPLELQPALGAPAPTPARMRHNVTGVDSILKTLSLREKIGQLIMPWLLGDYVSTEADRFDRALSWIDEHAVGGIIISIGSPLDAAAKLNTLQRRSRLPLIVAADLEWGAAMRTNRFLRVTSRPRWFGERRMSDTRSETFVCSRRTSC